MHVVEVHNSNGDAGPLWYRVGHSTDMSTISWQDAVTYDAGWNPKIAFTGDFLIEVHNGQAGAGPMWYKTGMLSGNDPSRVINFGTSIRYDNGYNPSVAFDPNAAQSSVIEVHNGGAGLGAEWYHVGIYQPGGIIQ